MTLVFACIYLRVIVKMEIYGKRQKWTLSEFFAVELFSKFSNLCRTKYAYNEKTYK